MSDIAVTVTSPGSVNATIGAGGAVSATVSSGGSVAVQLPSGSLAWGDISGKPTEFTPAAHTHKAADITDRSTALVTSVNGQTGDITITEGGGGASLSDAAPAALGVAAAGVSLEASRSDHVHDLPTAAEVGALDADSVIDGGDYVGYIPSNVITITQQPADATAIAGEASFSVAATVEPSGTLSYQWQRLAASGAGEAWSVGTMPGGTSTNWGGVAFGNGVFVAVSAQGVFAKKLPGQPWQIVTAPSSASFTQVVFGNGFFLAVAYDGTSAVSSDGTTWTQLIAPEGSSGFSLVYGGGKFVWLSSSGVVRSSSDGQSWSNPSILTETLWTDIAYGNGKFLAISSSLTATSPDGIAWSENQITLGVNWSGAAYGNGVFVMVNDENSATSADGVSWNYHQSPGVDAFGVMHGNGIFVSYPLPISSGVSYYTSTDGETWAERQTSAYVNAYEVAYGDGEFVAVGTNKYTAVSSAAQTWQAIQGGTSATLSLSGLVQSDDQSQHRVVLSATNAASVTSNAATLTVT